jgi:hypothetical protein
LIAAFPAAGRQLPAIGPHSGRLTSISGYHYYRKNQAISLEKPYGRLSPRFPFSTFDLYLVPRYGIIQQLTAVKLVFPVLL